MLNTSKKALVSGVSPGHLEGAEPAMSEKTLPANTQSREYTEKNLIFDVETNKIERVRSAICEKKWPVDTRRPTYEDTLLSRACWRGHYDIAEFLLSQGASVNATNYRHCTPLAECINAIPILRDEKRRVNAQALIKLLVRYGANPTIADNTTTPIGIGTPLVFASREGPAYDLLKDALLETYQLRINTLKTYLLQAMAQHTDHSAFIRKEQSPELRVWFAFIAEVLRAMMIRLNELQCLYYTFDKEPYNPSLLAIIYQGFEENKKFTEQYRDVLFKPIHSGKLTPSKALQTWLNNLCQTLASLWLMPYQQMIVLPWLNKVTVQAEPHEEPTASSTSASISGEFITSESSCDELNPAKLMTNIPSAIVILPPYHPPTLIKPEQPGLWEGFTAWFAPNSSSSPRATTALEADIALQLALNQWPASAIALLQQGANVHAYLNAKPEQGHLVSYYLHGAALDILRLLGLYGAKLHESLVIGRDLKQGLRYCYPELKAEIILLSAHASYQVRQQLTAEIQAHLNTSDQGAASSKDTKVQDMLPETAWALLQLYQDIGDLWWLETQSAHYPPPKPTSPLFAVYQTCYAHYQAQAIRYYQQALSYFPKLGTLPYALETLRQRMHRLYSRLAQGADNADDKQAMAKQAAYFSQSWQALRQTACLYFENLHDAFKRSLSISTSRLQQQQNQQQLAHLQEALWHLRATRGETAFETLEVHIDIIQAYGVLAKLTQEPQAKAYHLDRAHDHLQQVTSSLSSSGTSYTQTRLGYYAKLIQSWIDCYLAKSAQVELNAIDYIAACLTCGQLAKTYYEGVRQTAPAEEWAGLLTALQTLQETLQQAYAVFFTTYLFEKAQSSEQCNTELRRRNPRYSKALFHNENLESTPLLASAATSVASISDQKVDLRVSYQQLLQDYEDLSKEALGTPVPTASHTELPTDNIPPTLAPLSNNTLSPLGSPCLFAEAKPTDSSSHTLHFDIGPKITSVCGH